MVWAEAEFHLNTLQEDGSTWRDHYKSEWRQTGIKPAKLNQPDPPKAMMHLWGYYQKLNRSRDVRQQDGPAPISHSDIGWWAHLRGIKLQGWEADAIVGLDLLWRTSK